MSNSGILWIGPRDREFTAIAESLTQQSRLRVAVDCRSLTGAAPGLVILAQSHTGQYARAEVKQLRERWAQSRFLYLLGEWCCGEKRTNKEFDEVPAVYTHDVRHVTAASSFRSLARQFGEPLGGYSVAEVTAVSEGALVALYSPSKSFQRAVSDGLGEFSLKTVSLEIADGIPVTGVDFVVWDVAEDPEIRSHHLLLLRARHPGAQIIALVTFPREFEFQALEQSGVCVIAQPFRLVDLISLLKTTSTSIAVSAA